MNASSIALTSVKQMRVLAHPLRLRILGELRIGGPSTAGKLAELVDEAPGTLSYHLGKLSEFGFVAEAPELSTDRRERWWRAVHESTHLPDPVADAGPDEILAASALRHQIVDVYAATMHRVVDAGAEQPEAWTAAGTSGDSLAYLTVEELAEVSAELDAVLEKWHGKSDRSREAAEPVQFIAYAFRRP